MSNSITLKDKKKNPHYHEHLAETERNEKICALYRTGFYSYNKIARIYHVSPQNIARIIKAAGITKEEVHAE
jgi:DNA invertase Pin-like site-specific DNA recombinase